MYSVIGGDGQVYGPVDVGTLQRWCQEGRVGPQTNLIDPIDARVLPASSVQALTPYLPQQPPPYSGTPPPTVSPNANGGHQNVRQTGQIPIQINNYVGYPHPGPVYAPYSPPKNRVVAILLALILGGLGVHRFYLGHSGTGTAMLLITVLTCGWGGIVTCIWAIVDIILIATDGLRDVSGQPYQT